MYDGSKVSQQPIVREKINEIDIDQNMAAARGYYQLHCKENYLLIFSILTSDRQSVLQSITRVILGAKPWHPSDIDQNIAVARGY